MPRAMVKSETENLQEKLERLQVLEDCVLLRCPPRFYARAPRGSWCLGGVPRAQLCARRARNRSLEVSLHAIGNTPLVIAVHSRTVREREWHARGRCDRAVRP